MQDTFDCNEYDMGKFSSEKEVACIQWKSGRHFCYQDRELGLLHGQADPRLGYMSFSAGRRRN